jgi:hypothetical protein
VDLESVLSKLPSTSKLNPINKLLQDCLFRRTDTKTAKCHQVSTEESYIGNWQVARGSTLCLLAKGEFIVCYFPEFFFKKKTFQKNFRAATSTAFDSDQGQRFPFVVIKGMSYFKVDTSKDGITIVTLRAGTPHAIIEAKVFVSFSNFHFVIQYVDILP